MDDTVAEYRQELIESKSASQDQLDKALLTLSAGAFGITFAFIDNFITGSPKAVGWLFTSWIAWGCTISMSLVAFYLTIKSFAKSITKLDKEPESMFKNPFNTYDKTVKVLNLLSLTGFIIGLITIGIFVKINL